MANNTVYPYGTGGQLPSGIAIVNDLVTGGADKALSAEQGKNLYGMIDNEGTPTTETPIAISSLQSCGGVINVNTGKWVTLSGYDAALIPRTVFGDYDQVKITPASGNPTGIAFTVNGFSSGGTVQFASETTYTSYEAGSATRIIAIPDDANYIYIPLVANNEQRRPAGLELIILGDDKGLLQKCEELNDGLEAANEELETLSQEINGVQSEQTGNFGDWTLQNSNPNRYYKINSKKTVTGGVIIFKLYSYTTYKIGVVIQDGTAYTSTTISDTGWQTSDITKTISRTESGYNIRVTIARNDNTSMTATEFLSAIDELSYTFIGGENGLEQRVDSLEENSIYKMQRIPMVVIGTTKYVGKPIEIAEHEYTYENLGTLSNTGTSGQGRQGAAVFGDYLFQCHNTNNAVVVFKLSTKQNIQTIALTANVNNHANTAGFSGQYYDANDDFPCLYVSSEGESKVYLYRITGSEGNFALTLVQTLSFSVPYYYPNLHIDAPNNRGVVVGYKENSWQSPDGNKMMCCCFDLPNVTDGDVALSNPYGEFSFPFIYATQGAIARYGKLYHSFGNTNYGLNIGGIVVVDYILKNVESFIDLKAVGNYEPEGLSISNGGFIVTTNERVVFKITP